MASATFTMSSPEPRPLWLGQLFAGPEGPVRDGVRRLALTLPSYLFIAVMLGICAGLGYVRPWQAVGAVAYSTLGFAGFYGLVRSGVAARSAEPSLAFARVLFNTSTVMFIYALIPMARGLALQWMCMIILFDMRRLTAVQVRLVALTAYLLLITVVVAILKFAPESIDMGAEFVNVAMASVTLCVLLVVTHIGQGIDRHRKQQKAELERTVAQLNTLSVKDGLTQLFNRRHFQSLLDEEMRRSHRSGRPFCIAILDIDFFKRVNDQHGHATGDLVLREVSRLAQGALGPGQSLARWGGEEFLLLMPELAAPAAVATVEAVRKAVRAHDWSSQVAGLRVTLSAGVCAHDGSLNLGPTLEKADRALYRAKDGGRDQVMAAVA